MLKQIPAHHQYEGRQGAWLSLPQPLIAGVGEVIE
jgi:hypothetical protein